VGVAYSRIKLATESKSEIPILIVIVSEISTFICDFFECARFVGVKVGVATVFWVNR